MSLTCQLEICPKCFVGSTDFGNVSQIVPSICPAFDIGCTSGIHTNAFHDAANDDIAHGNIFSANLIKLKLHLIVFLY